MKDVLLKRLIVTGSSWSMLPIRLVVGTVFFAHGAQKLLGWFGGGGLSGTAHLFEARLNLFPGFLWTFLAGGAEFFGALLVCAGLLTRLGASIIGVVMAVAIWKVHLGAFFNPQGVEFPLSLLASSCALAVYGGGRWSVDRAMLRPELRPGGANLETKSGTG
ncbi:MAG TPA: DoxX family protein [Chthoniobacterales bacterium]